MKATDQPLGRRALLGILLAGAASVLGCGGEPQGIVATKSGSKRSTRFEDLKEASKKKRPARAGG